MGTHRSLTKDSEVNHHSVGIIALCGNERIQVLVTSGNDGAVPAELPVQEPTRISAMSAIGTFRPIDRRELRSAHWGIPDALGVGS
jgi:hypothetical protein